MFKCDKCDKEFKNEVERNNCICQKTGEELHITQIKSDMRDNTVINVDNSGIYSININVKNKKGKVYINVNM